MSTPSGYACLSQNSIAANAVAGPERPTWSTAIGRIRDRFRRRRQLQDLIELDDHLLADIGLTRGQALGAARRARWI